MSIVIPTWILWALGIAGGIIGVILMLLGIMFIVCFWNFRIF